MGFGGPNTKTLACTGLPPNRDLAICEPRLTTDEGVPEVDYALLIIKHQRFVTFEPLNVTFEPLNVTLFSQNVTF